ncbi:MAG: hypothetical protein Kow00107_01990 [Planctomycetota bacterium]
MRYAFPLFLALVVAITVCTSSTAEDVLSGIDKQIQKITADIARKFKIESTYEVDQRSITTLNGIYGFFTKLQETLETDKDSDWKRQIKEVKGLTINVHNNKEIGEIEVREKNSNALIVFKQSAPDFKKLLSDLVYEKKAYLDLSAQASRLKLSLKMGHDMCWSDAAVFIRSIEEYMSKNPKMRKLVKEMTLLLEKEVKTPPDYANRVVSVAYNLDKDTLLHKMENYSEEFEAYENAQKNIAELEKLGVKVQLSEPLRTAIFEKIWRAIDPATAVILEMTKNELNLAKLRKLPVIFNPEATVKKEDGYYISIYDEPTAIQRIL